MTTPMQPFADNILGLIRLHQRDLYSHDAKDVEHLRLSVLQKRFSTLRDGVGALRKLADLQGVSKIESLDDAVPLLFQHTVYKSYPMSLLEKGRFDALTKWLNQLTIHDLSGVDARGCKFVDEWLLLLEQKTPIKPVHTTGTTGKLSFIPRTVADHQAQGEILITLWQGVGNERNIEIDPNNLPVRLPIVYPGYRRGFYVGLRMLEEELRLFGDESKLEVLYNDLLSPDVLSLSGRVATAQARGQLDELEIAPELLQRFKRSQETLKNRAQHDAEFFDRALQRFAGQRVRLGQTVPQLYAWAAEGQRRGLKGIFAADSLISTAGGKKGQTIPDDWKQTVQEVIGAPVHEMYAMSEVCGMNMMCSHGNYHVPPYVIPYLLDPETGHALPRRGQNTGRAAFFDMVPDSYWGGFVSGDEITINWDGGCGCGRKGEYILPSISRFSEKNGGEDKISCAGAPDAQEKAMEFLSRLAEHQD